MIDGRPKSGSGRFGGLLPGD